MNSVISDAVIAKAAVVKLAIFDVDGVLTDGRLYFGAEGEVLKVFHVQDGLGLKLLQKSGVAVAIISSRQSEIVLQRLKNLGVKHIFQGHENKLIPFKKILDLLKLTPKQVAYTGDDLPDLPLIQQVGLGICVPNAHPLLKQAASWQTQTPGGHGAVREVCELIMQAQGTLHPAYQQYSLNQTTQDVFN